MKKIGITKKLDATYEEALARVPEALKAEGFGILTEIDVKATLKTKLDLDFRKYKILGACNPPLAHQALDYDLQIGLLLPCNVIVYENDEGKAVVSAIDPVETIASVGGEDLLDLAKTVKGKLERALATLE